MHVLIKKYGTIEDITDKGYYTGSYYLDAREEINLFDKLKVESEFQKLSNGGAISYIEIQNMENNFEELEEMVKYIYDNVQYVEFKAKIE